MTSSWVRVGSAASVLLASGAAFAGPDWVERGDAGSSLVTAQVPRAGVGSTTLELHTIAGVLAGPELEIGGERSPGDFEDLYLIRIADTSAFNITLINADFNPQFFLFNITINNNAYGLLANDDDPAGGNLPRLVSAATDATGVQIPGPGDYLLAITGFDNDPESITGPIFNQATTTEISGPDGPGGFNAFSQWQGDGEFGHYNFRLEGVEFPQSPAPGGTLVLALAGLAAARRRR